MIATTWVISKLIKSFTKNKNADTGTDTAKSVCHLGIIHNKF